jgi:3-oxoacyl-[acyl-carrier-protein] synthase-3
VRRPLARIIGTGGYAPARVLTNQDLERMVDTSDAWITERTGIKERHIAAAGETTSDMAAEACRRALEMAGVAPDEIDLLALGTVTPDMQMPSTAVHVQRKLGLTRAACWDQQSACAGFIFGLAQAEKFVALGEAKYALVVGVELLSKVLDWQDRNTCVLFGDGAGAVVLARSEFEERGILSTHIRTDGTLWNILNIPGGGSWLGTSHATVDEKKHKVHMNGREVFKVAVRNISEITMEALARNGLRPGDIDLVVAHQANIRILEGVAKRCELPMERFYLNIERYGNTSSASIPIALDEALRAGRVRDGMNLLFTALGAGMAWGAAIVRW